MVTDSDIIGIFGICLEILGFLLMLKYYNRKLTAKAVHIWKEKNKIGHPEWIDDTIKIELSPEYGSSLNVPKRFYFFWRLTNQTPIYIVIAGLAIQILQILYS